MKHFRRANLEDSDSIESLYRLTASKPSGLARRPDEIHCGFGRGLVKRLLTEGLILVAEADSDSRGPVRLLGEIHGSFNNISNLRHVMNQVTIVIHPEWQGLGLGKLIFQNFLSIVRRDYPSIYRVELRTRASNVAGLRLYRSLGFAIEGKFLGRIRGSDGKLEDGYPMVWFNPNFNDEKSNIEQSLFDL